MASRTLIIKRGVDATIGNNCINRGGQRSLNSSNYFGNHVNTRSKATCHNSSLGYINRNNNNNNGPGINSSRSPLIKNQHCGLSLSTSKIHPNTFRNRRVFQTMCIPKRCNHNKNNNKAVVTARSSSFVRQQLRTSSRNKSSSSSSTSKSTAINTATTPSSNSGIHYHSQIQANFRSLKDKLQHKLLQPRVVPIPRWISPRTFSYTISECFGHASFILVAISYATDDFLLLRIIAVAGSTSMLFFTYFHPHGRVLWLPLQWNALFIIINGYRIGKSLYYNYVGHYLMSEDMKRVKDEYFQIVDMSDFAKLCSIAEEESFREGEMVVFQGQKNPYIRVVIEGELDVLRDGVKTYSLSEGNFIAEAGLHAGLFLTGTVESCCTIVASGEINSNENSSNNGQKSRNRKQTKCLKWDRTELIHLLNQNNGLRRSVKAVLSWDIVRKLKAQRQTIAESKVDDPEFWTQKRQEQSEDRYAGILQNMLQNPEYFKKRKDALDHYRMMHVSINGFFTFLFPFASKRHPSSLFMV